MKTIKYGIIGCGMMGQEHLRNIALLSDVEASVIYEPDAGMRAAAADLAPMATFADSELDVLNAPDIDCLLVVSPNHEHLRQLECALDAPHRPLLWKNPCTPSRMVQIELCGFNRSILRPFGLPWNIITCHPLLH